MHQQAAHLFYSQRLQFQLCTTTKPHVLNTLFATPARLPIMVIELSWSPTLKPQSSTFQGPITTTETKDLNSTATQFHFYL